MCPYVSYCESPFYLIPDKGEVKPSSYEPPQWWVMWPKCPRLYQATYLIDTGYGSLARLIAWEYELGTHKKNNLTARANELFRLWFQSKGTPEAIRSHRAITEAKASHGS
jgi:hypothetical protein